jgi:hypothetical protein
MSVFNILAALTILTYPGHKHIENCLLSTFCVNRYVKMSGYMIKYCKNLHEYVMVLIADMLRHGHFLKFILTVSYTSISL